MRVIMKSALVLALTLTTTQLLASIVPSDQDVVGATLDGQGGNYVDGYVELNRSTGTISIVLQPVMPVCPEDKSCIAVMPRQVDYFFTKVSRVLDECGAVTYSAQQADDRLIKVTVVDNSAYNYGQCPTFAPLDVTAVTVEQTSLDNGSESQETLAGSELTAVRF